MDYWNFIEGFIAGLCAYHLYVEFFKVDTKNKDQEKE